MNSNRLDKKIVHNDRRAKDAVNRISGSLALSGCMASPIQKALMLDIIQGRVNADEALRAIIESRIVNRNRV